MLPNNNHLQTNKPKISQKDKIHETVAGGCICVCMQTHYRNFTSSRRRRKKSNYI